MKGDFEERPEWRPIEVPRAANCLNCGRRIYAAVGDTFGGRQVWRHCDTLSWGSSFCFTDPEGGGSMAVPNLATLEWLKALYHRVQDVNGYRGHWPVEVSYYRPKHRGGARVVS